MVITITALKVSRKYDTFNLFADLVLSMHAHTLHEGDVIVISSKYVAISQGRTINESSVIATNDARKMAQKLKMRTRLAEAVLRESELIMGGVAGFAMALTGGILAPNAGIDSSNSHEDEIILYPADSYNVAEQIRRKTFLKFGIHVGIVIADSRLLPMRAGTCGVAIAFAGLNPVNDQRGKIDLDGKPLVVTKIAIADSIATMANHAMGEGSELTPFAIVCGTNAQLGDLPASAIEASVPPDECIYARSMVSNK